MAHRLIFSLVVLMAFTGAALAGRRVRPAETAELAIDTSFEHAAAQHLRSLHTSIVNGRKLKGIKVAEVERQMRNYDDLRDALASAQKNELAWLTTNTETFDKPNNVAVDFFSEINKALNEGEMTHDLASQLIAETKQKRQESVEAQDKAIKELEEAQSNTRKAAKALEAHVKAMEALVEKSKHAELEKPHAEEEEQQAEKKAEKTEKAAKGEEKTEKKKAEKKSEKVEKSEKTEKQSKKTAQAE